MLNITSSDCSQRPSCKVHLILSFRAGNTMWVDTFEVGLGLPSLAPLVVSWSLVLWPKVVFVV